MAGTLNLIKSIMNSDEEFITDEQRLRPKDSEVFRLKGDNTLIHELTVWTPMHTLTQGLKDTIDWFKSTDNLIKYKPGVYKL